jgi:hypothetical protein
MPLAASTSGRLGMRMIASQDLSRAKGMGTTKPAPARLSTLSVSGRNASLTVAPDDHDRVYAVRGSPDGKWKRPIA